MFVRGKSRGFLCVAGSALFASFTVAMPMGALAGSVYVTNTGIAPPTTKLLSAPLISPISAAAFYGSGTGHTDGPGADTGAPPEISALAASLLGGRNIAVQANKDEFVQKVFDYVRNNIDTDFRYGLSKGGRGALIDQSGTPFDQAELMVDLLREGGVAASYQTGEVTMTGQQFGQWTGLVNSLNVASQAVTVDAASACAFLADGGIPATVNGASSCSGLTGNLTTTTLGHIWVMVGSTRYDPSYKIYALKNGIDLSAAMGCGTDAASTCGSSIKAAGLTGAITDADSGMNYVKDFNPLAIDTAFKNYSVALQHTIEGVGRSSQVTDIVGGKELTLQTQTLALTYANRTLWTGEIPDAYRTSLSLEIDCGTYTFFADDIAGKRLMVTQDMANLVVLVNNATIGSPTSASCPHLDANAYISLAVDVDHPYAANSGAYADEVVGLKPIEDTHTSTGLFSGEGGSPTLPTGYNQNAQEKVPYGSYPMTIIHGFGQSSPSRISQSSSLQSVLSLNTRNCHPSTISTVATMTCGGETQGTVADTVASYRSLASRLIDGVAKVQTTRHHSIGLIYASRRPDSFLTTVEEAMSVSSNQGNSAGRAVGFELQAITLSEVERDMNLSVPGDSFASKFWGNYALTDPNLWRIETRYEARKIYEVTPDKMSIFLASMGEWAEKMQYSSTPGFTDFAGFMQASANSPRTYGFPCILYQDASTGCWRKLQLQDLAAQGYTTIIAEGGQAEFVYKGANERAYTIQEYLKGSVVADEPLGKVMKTAEIADANSIAKKQLSITNATGDLSFSATPDLVTGAGDFPYSLPFIRTFKASSYERTKPLVTKWYNGSDGLQTDNRNYYMKAGWNSQSNSRLGGGWVHNYEIIASFAPDAGKNLGNDTALEATYAIAQIRVLKDLIASPDLPGRLASIKVAEGFGANGAFVLKIGADSEFFQVQPDGSFYNSAHPDAKLEILKDADNLVTGLTYTGQGGDVINFTWSLTESVPYNALAGTFTLPASVHGNIFKADSWIFPTGVRIDFDYDDKIIAQPDDSVYCALWNNCFGPTRVSVGRVLKKVRNNLGHSLTFTTVGQVSGNLNNYYKAVITSVQDENGRTVTFNKGSCDTLTCDTFQMTSPNNIVTTYEYAADASSPNPVSVVRENYHLRRIITPTSTTPFETVIYDGLFRVKQVKDRNAHITKYYPGGLAGTEIWKSSDTISPVGDRSTVVFNDKNADIYSRTPMGRVTTKTYDDANRLVKTFLPEGNGTENIYDVRGNAIQVRRFSKTCAPTAATCSDDINTYTSYVEGPTVLTCANIITCNKPLTEMDGRGAVTNYSWNATTGNLTQIKKPADRAGTRPQTDLGYTTYSGMSLLTSKTEKITASQSVITAYSYDSANHYVLKDMTVDSGGLALKTTLGFDGVGNMISVDGPRTDVTDVTNYKWDPDRRLTAIISPDPDAAGPMLRKMVNYTYNPDGLVTRTDTGTATAADGTGFSITTSEISTYDAMGNKTQSKVVKP